MLALLLCASVVVVHNSARAGANEIPWRDLGAAENNLIRARGDADTLAAALADTDAKIASASNELQFVTAGDGDRAATVQAWRERSRQLTVEAYMNSGNGASIGLLSMSASTDQLYRTILTADQAQAALDAASIYADLIEGTGDDVVIMIEDIDGLVRRRDGLELDLARVQRQIAEAEWVVEIATIHDLADQEFATNGRPDPTAQQWAALRHCESTNTYNINTGNTFYGAYQFDYQTWFTVGGEPGTRADQASPEEQDARARLLYSRRGSQPWPVCGRFLP